MHQRGPTRGETQDHQKDKVFEPDDFLCGGDAFAGLAFVGGPLKIGDAAKNDGKRESPNEERLLPGKVTDEHRCAAAESSQAVERENSTTVAKTKIGKTVGGVILAWRGKRQQAAARAGNRHEGCVEDGHAQDQNRCEPGGKMTGVFQAEFQAESCHQVTEKHGAAIAHENFRRLEIPAEKPSGSAENGGSKSGDQRLAVQVGEHGKENGGHGRDTCAQAIHVIEDAERGGDSHDPNDSEDGVQKISTASANEYAENLRADSADQKNRGGEWHACKEFNLMMEQSAVVEDTDTGDERRADEDTHN